uniref:Uncharacterized protein n=1 Tax=Timspurckia oligopyrenoides TaxID=708627 RepID=A0A7S0ZDA7_9RHOD|mmetsp:Transcript_13358/g.23978  ORF Transcript_13358/g.23978 Transcript_13358/m.23978 type:complete len:106 (+) Transcript_13358:1096-1413(+)
MSRRVQHTRFLLVNHTGDFYCCWVFLLLFRDQVDASVRLEVEDLLGSLGAVDLCHCAVYFGSRVSHFGMSRLEIAPLRRIFRNPQAKCRTKLDAHVGSATKCACK